MQETQVRSSAWEDLLEKEMAICSSIIAWKIPWTKEPGEATFHGIARVRHDLATKLIYLTKRQQQWHLSEPMKNLLP